MPLTLAQRLNRIDVRTAELSSWSKRQSLDVGGWTFDGQPLAVGAAWPEVAGRHAFAATAEVPSDWPLAETRLEIDVGGESLIHIEAEGHIRSFGLDPNHRRFPVQGRSLAIRTESVARLPFGQPVPAPKLEYARLVWIEPEVEELRLLLRQIREAAEVLGEHDVVPHLVELAETALRDLDWPSETGSYLARTVDTAQRRAIWQAPPVSATQPPLTDSERARLIEVLTRTLASLDGLKWRFPPQGKVTITGHAHIDLAWLWPYAETRNKVRRTFNTALGLMETSADFRFNQSSAAFYAQLEEDDPALFAAVKAKVASGQWEPIGGMWVEPDTNMPNGESLVRQVLYGQRYFEKTFGRRHSVCWLPDCFGFSAALPQILKQGGLKNFFTVKVNWNETNRYPHDLFWWQGLDGSRVLAHTFENPYGGYNGELQPAAAHATWKRFRGKPLHDESLLSVGYGDGGGGVTTEMVDRARQLAHFPALPTVAWGRVEDVFARAASAATTTALPVWQGEMVMEGHRAVFTTQSLTKRLHRQAERALITAETVAGMAHLLGAEAPASLEPQWRVVLKNEFHDILPGSSIAEVYEDARAELSAVVAAGEAVQRQALDAIAARLPEGAVADGVVVVNPTLSARPIDIRLGDAVLATTLTVPPLSARVVAKADLAAEVPVEVSVGSIENRYVKVAIGADGTVTSLVLKAGEREAVAGRANQLWAYRQDKPRNWDAWDLEEDYAASGEEISDVVSIDVVAATPAYGAVRVVKRWRHSTITQTYSLSAVSRRLDIATEIDWHDRRAIVRVLNPLAVASEHALYEVAFGVVRRTTHDNTSWDWARFEVSAHRFSVLEEPGFGVALINDGKYGHSARGNTLGLSLVRGPIYPDPLADEGRQSFTYALYPYAGAWHEAGVREEADALNQPLLAKAVSGRKAGVVGTIATHGARAALAALKPAEDGDGLILRVNEPAGGRGGFSVMPPAGWTVGEPLSILEEPMARDAAADLMPFEIRSWRLRRG
jgi:alpha-mannosidase